MSKRFSSNAPLSGTIMETNFEQLESLLAFHSSIVKPYYLNDFIHPPHSEITELTFGHLTMKIVEGKNYINESISNASKFAYDEAEHASFLERLRTNVLKRIPQLALAVKLSGIFPQIRGNFFEKVVENMLKACEPRLDILFGNLKSSSPLHMVDNVSSDILYHLTVILSTLSNPHHNGRNNGMVVVCSSPRLLLPLFILTDIIAESSPPPHLFTYLPSLQKRSSHRLGCIIPVVFHSADIDSAARECCASVRQGNVCFWRSAIILVEESIELKFREKLRHVSAQSRVDEQKCESKENAHTEGLLNYIDTLKNKFGTTMIASSSGLPMFISDVPPSALSSDINWSFNSVGHIIKFRTAKEACSIATYFSNQARYSQGELLNAAGSLNIVANLWLNSPALCWQLSEAIGSAGIQRVFVNAANERLLLTLYKELLEVDDFGAPYYIPDHIADVDDVKPVSQLTNLLTLSLKAQHDWSSQSFVSIRKKLIGKHLTNDLLVSPANSAWKSFVFTSSLYLNSEERFGLLNKEQTTVGELLLARQWLKPCGPVVFVLWQAHDESSGFVNFLLHTILLAICSGNSVILFLIEAAAMLESHSWFTDLLQISSAFPTNLVTKCCSPSLRTENVHQFLQLVEHPGIVISPESRWSALSSGDTSTDVTPYCFVRRLKLFWSVGAEIFSN